METIRPAIPEKQAAVTRFEWRVSPAASVRDLQPALIRAAISHRLTMRLGRPLSAATLIKALCALL